MKSPTIAFLLEKSAGGPAPHLSPVTEEIVTRLKERNAHVDILVPEEKAFDVADLRPAHDLYVLKSESALAVSVAGALCVAGASVVNAVRAVRLARDKVAATAVLAASGVPVPPSWTTGKPSLLAPLLAGGPLWIKPRGGTKGRGIVRAAAETVLPPDETCLDGFGLPQPLFAQREVPSNGIDLKVYVVGERTWAVSRPYPVLRPRDKDGIPATLAPEIRDAALLCGRSLGLELYGVDFLVDGGRFHVVDVNAFPGYKSVGGAPRALAEYLFHKGELARNERIRNGATT